MVTNNNNNNNNNRQTKDQANRSGGPRRADLEDVGSLDEAHEGQEAPVRPAVDRHAAQVHEVEPLGHVLQPLHLVLDLHLALGGGGTEGGRERERERGTEGERERGVQVHGSRKQREFHYASRIKPDGIKGVGDVFLREFIHVKI